MDVTYYMCAHQMSWSTEGPFPQEMEQSQLGESRPDYLLHVMQFKDQPPQYCLVCWSGINQWVFNQAPRADENLRSGVFGR